MGYALDLLSEVFQAQGMDPAQAKKVAGIALAVEVAAGLTSHRAIEAVDRDAHVYKLRGMRTVGMEPMTVVVISSRVGVCRQEIFKALRRHQTRRLAVLRLMIA